MALSSGFSPTQTWHKADGSTVVYTLTPPFITPIMNGALQCKVAYGIYSPGGSPRTHYGFDVSTRGGDKRVFAAAAGKVIMSAMVPKSSGDKTWEWGNFVCILDAAGCRHYYYHLASRAVSVGQAVKAGDQLGVMGATGNAAADSQGEHIHYEVRKPPYGTHNSTDPTPWLGMPNLQGWVDFAHGSGITKGVQTMKVVDVYAGSTASKTGSKAFNVQTFTTPDVSKIAGNNLPDGRYWCNEIGVTLAGLSECEGAQIIVDSKAMYVAIIPGATEYTEMACADAYARFVKASDGAGYTEAEMVALKARLATTKTELADARAKITAAQKALGV